MWLLSTARAEHHFFSEPSAVPGGFAILSHTWSPKGELSFQQLQKIYSNCQQTGENPRDHVHEKIRKCCEVAERDGYSWVWIDTCCINKESSTELSEAINSMFSWYVLSEVCYAYLEDVHEDDNPHASDSEFRRSRWHTRGWTLQELLGPALLVFMSREWEPIGTKYDLCKPLSERTAIPNEYLTRKYLISAASISERMLWASKRETSRIEDEAYCLLGLFDITMPILYGERTKAFQRLQLKLAKQQYVDTTLFAWGPRHYDEHSNLPAVPLPTIWSRFHGANHWHNRRFLFATSPRDYSGPSTYNTPKLNPTSTLQPYVFSQWTEDLEQSVEYIGKKETGPFGSIELPSCEVTGYGFKCRFPVAEVDGFTIAVLLAQTNDSHLGMFLHQAPKSELQDPTRRMYYVGWPFKNSEKSYFIFRLADLGSDLYHLSFRGKPVNAIWRDIYIHTTPRTIDRVDPLHLVLKLYADQAPGRFRFPRQLVQTMIKLGFFPGSGTTSSDPNASESVWVSFEDNNRSEMIRVSLGLCTKDSVDGAPIHWAFAESSDISNWDEPWKAAHDCQNDHLADWKDGGHTFGDEERRIRLTFVKCPHSPEHTRVIRMELSGSVYNTIQHEEGITIGEREDTQSRPVHSGTSLTTRAVT